MSNTIETISLNSLTVALIPALVVLLIFIRWSLSIAQPAYALLRMLTQLLLVGYALSYIFASQSSELILLILVIMCLASSWIALGSITQQRSRLFKYAFLAIFIGGGLTLALITQGTLQLFPWYAPHYMIPIAGMVFANSMNSVSLAAERLHSETQNNADYMLARNTAFHAAMIPVINSLFAVGLVSLPGMMTGQILSGISPFVAARYQIMVMAMIFGSSGLSTAIYLSFVKSIYLKPNS
ncbi:MAG: putative ABC transport system permease protein [Methyloprofundus sp.]|nr:MAG: putative ABC transport system permease protein [Methyloprofundus sp.]